jgi:hypothetical protein
VSGHHATTQIVSAVRGAFVAALGTGLTIGAVVTTLGAVAALTLIKSGGASAPATQADTEPVPAEAAESELTLV